MQKRWSVPRNKIKRYKNLHLNPNSQAHLFLGILFIGRIIILNLFLFSIRQVVLGAETVFQRKTTNWSHLKFSFIHDQSNLKCYQSEQWLPQWKTCKPKIWLFLLLFVCVGFLHWCWLCFVLFLIIHRHNCIFWVKAAHQLPLFIDLFIFIYLFRKKPRSTVCVLPVTSQAAGILGMYILMEKKTLKNMRGTAFEHLVTILFQLQTCNQKRNAVNASQWYNQQRSGRTHCRHKVWWVWPSPWSYRGVTAMPVQSG